MASTIDSSGRAYDAARSHAQAVTAEQFLNDAFITHTQADAIFGTMSDVIKKKIDSRDCQIRLMVPSDLTVRTDLMSSREIGIRRTFVLFKVSGESDCPIKLSFKIVTLLEPSIGRFAISFDYSYAVLDPTYVSFNDVTAVELHGGVSTNGLGSGSVTRESDFKGHLDSQSIGTVNIESFGSLRGSNENALNGSVQLSLIFPDFSGVFKKSYDSGSISYSLNDESISDSDFESHFGVGGEPFVYFGRTDLIQFTQLFPDFPRTF